MLLERGRLARGIPRPSHDGDYAFYRAPLDVPSAHIFCLVRQPTFRQSRAPSGKRALPNQASARYFSRRSYPSFSMSEGQIITRDPSHVIATYENVLITVWRAPGTGEKIRRIRGV